MFQSLPNVRHDHGHSIVETARPGAASVAPAGREPQMSQEIEDYMMTALPVSLPLSARQNDRKKVLLVGHVGSRRMLRTKALESRGVEVVCAGDVAEARALWHQLVYDLVLFECNGATLDAEDFCREMKVASPGERVAFYVGKPDYLASAPNGNGHVPGEELSTGCGEPMRAMVSAACAGLPQRRGFLEAVWRMQLARSSARRPSPDPAPRAIEPRRSAPALAASVPAPVAFGEAVRRAERVQEVMDVAKPQ